MIIANRASSILFSYLKNLEFKNDTYFGLPANICIDVLLTFITAEIPFKFIDLDKEQKELDLESFLNEPYKVIGILYNHHYGNEYTPYNSFNSIKSRFPHIQIVDDRCLCNAQIDYHLPNNVDLALFSTGKKKQVDLGCYGYAFTNDLNFKIKYFKHDVKPLNTTFIQNIIKSRNKITSEKPILQKQNISWLDFNIPDISFGHLMTMIVDFETQNLSHKSALTQIYSEKIHDYLKYTDEFQNWRYNIKCQNPEEINKILFQQKLFASQHYKPISDYFDFKCENATKAYKTTVNLFKDKYFTEQQALETTRIINKYASPLQ